MVACYVLTAVAIEILMAKHGFNADEIENTLSYWDTINRIMVDPTIAAMTFSKETCNGKYRQPRVRQSFHPYVESTEVRDAMLEDGSSLGYKENKEVTGA